jgi:phosphohistidine phosphatase
MELYFLRHGRAVDGGSWHGSDFDRPLTDEGRDRMMREAKAIKHLVSGLDHIVTSPLVRARQTAEIVADALKMRDRLVEDERLGSGFELDRLADVLRARQGANALMLVGHEPAMSALVGRLIGSAAVEFKPGSLARVDLQDTSRLAGELIWLVPPKALLL